MKIIILGASGQLGSATQAYLDTHHPEVSYKAFSSKEINLLNDDEVLSQLSALNFDHLINCAAYTNVDLAETEREQAMQINGTILKAIAQVCQQKNAGLWHVSTDYVFGNYQGDTPITETETPSPVNYYAISKYQGEQLAQQYCDNTRIIRTAGLYSEHGHNFKNTMLRLAKDRDELRIVDDQMTCPTTAEELARIIIGLITVNATPGIYHGVGDTPLSWHQFACQIFKENGIDITVTPITTAEYPLPATRPHYSVLDNSKVKKLLGFSR